MFSSVVSVLKQVFGVGDFLIALITFIVVALVVFVVVKAAKKWHIE
jgi:large-conductance mechanosensitive channel